MAIIAVIQVNSGILEEFELFSNEEEALKRGKELWGEREIDAELEELDPEWGGVARFFTMHWFNGTDDVWVIPPGPGDMSAWSLLSPEMFNAIGRHTMDAAAEEVVAAQEESVDDQLREAEAAGL